jgi:hypothetical protein
LTSEVLALLAQGSSNAQLARRGKMGVGKRAYRDAHRVLVALFGVEDVGSAFRAEPEPSPQREEKRMAAKRSSACRKIERAMPEMKRGALKSGG